MKRLSEFLSESWYRVSYTHAGGEGSSEVEATNPVTARSTAFGRLHRDGKKSIRITGHEELK